MTVRSGRGRNVERIAHMVAMAMGEDDVGHAANRRRLIGHEGRVAGEERVDQYGLAGEVETESGMAVPGDLHGGQVLGCEMVGRKIRDATPRSTRERRNITPRAPVAEDRRSSCRRQYRMRCRSGEIYCFAIAVILFGDCCATGSNAPARAVRIINLCIRSYTAALSVPHPKRNLSVGTVKSIYRQAGWPTDGDW